MVNISKRSLSKKKLTELFSQLNAVIGCLSETQSESFLRSFLGREEQIMLAKRLAAIVMLRHGKSLYRVSSALEISPNTAQNYKTALDNGTYDSLFASIKKKKAAYVDLLDAIDEILHLGGLLPHYGQTYASEAYHRRRAEKE